MCFDTPTAQSQTGEQVRKFYSRKSHAMFPPNPSNFIQFQHKSLMSLNRDLAQTAPTAKLGMNLSQTFGPCWSLLILVGLIKRGTLQSSSGRCCGATG
jgi:hypothetical protein